MSQAMVAGRIGCSHQLVSLMERDQVAATLDMLAAFGAAVGLDVTLRAFDGGSPLRDAGQLAILARFHARLLTAHWEIRSEVPVTRDPRDRRAFDNVLRRGSEVVAVEAIARLTDAQEQARRIVLKQTAAAIPVVVLVLGESRHNREAVKIAAPTLIDAFPLAPRTVIASLRAGRTPAANGIAFV